MRFTRQEYWVEMPWPPPGDLPDPGIEPVSPMSPARAETRRQRVALLDLSEEVACWMILNSRCSVHACEWPENTANIYVRVINKC